MFTIPFTQTFTYVQTKSFAALWYYNANGSDEKARNKNMVSARNELFECIQIQTNKGISLRSFVLFFFVAFCFLLTTFIASTLCLTPFGWLIHDTYLRMRLSPMSQDTDLFVCILYTHTDTHRISIRQLKFTRLSVVFIEYYSNGINVDCQTMRRDGRTLLHFILIFQE